MSKRMYIDRDEFHSEMIKCKRSDALSNRAIQLFGILAKEVSRRYYFEHEEDYDDAAATATYDLLKYWRGFKENSVVQLQIIRNFHPGEVLSINIDNMAPLLFMAATEEMMVSGKPVSWVMPVGPDSKPRFKGKLLCTQFLIGETANKSLMALTALCKNQQFGVYLDRVKCKITFMDNLNLDPDYTTYNSTVEFFPVLTGETFAYDDKGKNVMETVIIDGKSVKQKKMELGLMPISDSKFITQNRYKFKKSPNSFSYFTSVASNGILKYIDVRNPKALRNGNLVSRSEFTFFNI